MREQVIEKILEEKLIIIARGFKKERIVPMAEALYRGGVRLMEVTYDAKGAVPDEETAEMIAMLAKNFEGRMMIGSGTTLTTKQVEMTKEAGGEFIISPDTCREVIEKTRELGMVSIPGALTPTEIANAHRYGADFVKLFPISAFDRDYVKALVAPLSHVKLLAVGGIKASNMNDYAGTGIRGFGLGASTIISNLPSGWNNDDLAKMASHYVNTARAFE